MHPNGQRTFNLNASTTEWAGLVSVRSAEAKDVIQSRDLGRPTLILARPLPRLMNFAIGGEFFARERVVYRTLSLGCRQTQSLFPCTQRSERPSECLSSSGSIENILYTELL